MSFPIVHSLNKTTVGLFDTVDDGIDILRYGTKIVKRGAKKEARISLVEEFLESQTQDQGNTYTPQFQAILDRHDAGEIV